MTTPEIASAILGGGIAGEANCAIKHAERAWSDHLSDRIVREQVAERPYMAIRPDLGICAPVKPDIIPALAVPADVAELAAPRPMAKARPTCSRATAAGSRRAGLPRSIAPAARLAL